MSKFISLCMIVKNEEAVLERCLNSVKDWVDEIVIVDTGSTDGTKEIARRYTDNLIDFEWCDDFAAARNAALSQATGKWILHLDADEYMEPLTREEVHEKLLPFEDKQPIGIEFTIYSLLDRSAHTQWLTSSNIRLFSNHPEVRYDRPIHEWLIYHGQPLPQSSLPFSIYHTGYLTTTYQNKQKNNRNLAIFDKRRKDGKKDPIDNFYLGNEYHALGDLKKAAYYYKRGHEHRRKKLPWSHHVAIRYIHVLLALNHFRDAIEVADESIALWPQFPDFYCQKANILTAIGLEDEAIALYSHCIQLSEQMAKDRQNFWLISPEYASYTPYEQMAAIYARRLNFADQVACLSKLVQLNPHRGKYWYNLLLVLTSKESNQAALQFLEGYAGTKDSGFFREILHVSFLLKNDVLGKYAEEGLTMACNDWLSDFEKMYSALLERNAELFRDQWNMVQNSQVVGDEVAEPLLLGALVFDDPQILHSAHEKIPKLVHDLSEYWFNTEQGTEAPAWNYLVLETLKALFMMGEIDLYNRLYQRYAAFERVLSSEMANFLFDLGQYDIALHYYVNHMEKDELDQQGYSRLIQYYLHLANDRETARQLAEEAAARYPQLLFPYYDLIRHLTDGLERSQWQQRVRREVTLPVSISEIPSLN